LKENGQKKRERKKRKEKKKKEKKRIQKKIHILFYFFFGFLKQLKDYSPVVDMFYTLLKALFK